MAATAVYAVVSRIPTDGMSDEAYKVTNSDNLDTTFNLKGGMYGFTCKASTYGTVTLQILALDGATWLDALTGITADGGSNGALPLGKYRVHAS